MDDDRDGKGRNGRIVGKILPAAVRLWLRSQTERVDELSIDISGRDRDILSGYLPGVSLAAEQSIYQGIHIGRLYLSAADIRINVGQVVRGKPLRLLKAFPVLGEVVLSEDDLNASLSSPLLRQGLKDFWRSLTQNPAIASSVEAQYGPLPLSSEMVVEAAQVKLKGDRLGLRFYPCINETRGEQPVTLGTGLVAVNGNCLQLIAPRWIADLADVDNLDKGQSIEALHNFQWNLGSDTEIDHLGLKAESMIFKGQIMVNP
ncbi:MAG: DUF2993 domain-containing protein [Cyanobacteria bacterium P01_D01_bin.105]